MSFEFPNLDHILWLRSWGDRLYFNPSKPSESSTQNSPSSSSVDVTQLNVPVEH